MGDIADDIIDDGMNNAEAQQEAREQDWIDGYHTNKKGIRMKISDMDSTYLHNTIGFFKRQGHDVSALEAEVKSREK